MMQDSRAICRLSKCRRRKGLALVMTLLAVGLAFTLAMSFVSSQGTTAGIARNLRDRAVARYVAESGLELAIAYVTTTSNWRSSQSQGTWVSNTSFGSGTFTLVGQDGWDANGNGTISIPGEGDGNLGDDASDLLTLTVTGAAGAARHVVRAVLTPAVPSTPGVAVGGSIELIEGAIIDGMGGTPVVATNSTQSNKVKLSGGARIEGDVKVGPGANPNSVIQIIPSGVITGTKTALDSAVTIANAAEPSMGASVGNLDYSWTTETFTGDIHCGSLTVAGSSTVQISGNVRILADGAVRFTDAGRLILLPGAKLTLFCKSTLMVGGSAQVNVNTADPSALVIEYLGSTEVPIEGQCLIYATMTAGISRMSVTGSGQYYGRFYGRDLKMNGGSRLHVSAGGGGGAGTTYTVVRGE
jgi:hypothetical protein